MPDPALTPDSRLDAVRADGFDVSKYREGHAALFSMEFQHLARQLREALRGNVRARDGMRPASESVEGETVYLPDGRAGIVVRLRSDTADVAVEPEYDTREVAPLHEVVESLRRPPSGRVVVAFPRSDLRHAPEVEAARRCLPEGEESRA